MLLESNKSGTKACDVSPPSDADPPPTSFRTDADLLEEFQQLDQQRRSLEARSARILAELHRRGSTDKESGHRTKAWVAQTEDSPGRYAARELRIARLLAECPILIQALEAGGISTHHVDAIAKATNIRNLDFVIGAQQRLIDMIASYTRFERWEIAVRDLLAIADPDGGHDPRPGRNRLALSQDLHGELHLRATFVGPWAVTVKSILEQLADKEFRRHKADADNTDGELSIPSRGTLMALAFVEACRRAAAASGSGRGPVTDVTLVVHSDNPHRATTPDGRPVDEYSASLFRCDPVIHPVVLNSLGVPLDLGRSVRYATNEQRRALAARDGGCVFAGCDAPHSWTDAHHVYHWEHGGSTDLHSLASLCRHHHGVVHRTGWQMVEAGNGTFEFTTPSGQKLMSQRHGQVVQRCTV